MGPTAPAAREAHGLNAGAELRSPDSFDGNRQLAWIMAQFRPNERTPFQFLLLFRFSLLNIIAFALLGAAWFQGFVEMVLIADPTRLCVIIFLVFLVGLVYCALRVWQTSRELNLLHDFDPLVPSKAAAYLAQIRGRSDGSRAILSSAMRIKLSQRISGIRHIAGSLVLLGLVGTVVGFIIALSGVDPEKASDIESVSPMVSTL
ncbi:MAG: hypothetical protein QNI93_00645, partial [Kiloniellales bacterium]|nr:hypothetical protein [Kiloniellales bacterium]